MRLLLVRVVNSVQSLLSTFPWIWWCVASKEKGSACGVFRRLSLHASAADAAACQCC
jgi:hypothetical protein